MQLSELRGDETLKSLDESMRDKALRDAEFGRRCAGNNREIQNARDDIDFLMLRSHAYVNNSGLESHGFSLPKTPPRHQNFPQRNAGNTRK